jgi:hypothetical protein
VIFCTGVRPGPGDLHLHLDAPGSQHVVAQVHEVGLVEHAAEPLLAELIEPPIVVPRRP